MKSRKTIKRYKTVSIYLYVVYICKRRDGKTKKLFTEQIKMIYWRNKIASTTMNLTQGKQVTEIEIFEIRLASPEIDETVLRQIDQAIPYHILFLLEYDGMYQVWGSYKEAVSGKALFQVNTYYHTDWQKKRAACAKIGRAEHGSGI